MGPSGSGKSTLMHILAGLDKPTSGTVRIAGTEITTLGDNDLTKLRRQHIGFVFQFFNLLPMLTAEENVCCRCDRGREARRRLVRRPRRPGRAEGPADAPSGRALRRPAAACGDRARARLAPDGRLRRRADRQPRLETSGEILELLRHSVDASARRRDGHPRRACGGDGRSHPLSRRRADRQGAARRERPRRS